MSNDPLLKKIQSFQPWDSTEADFVERLLNVITTTAQPFHRETLEGHITGSAFVVNPNRDRLLLIHHRKLHRWLQPGGHCDGNPDTLAVAQKEVFEETGCITQPIDKAIFDIDIHLIPEKNSIPKHWHYDIRYLLEADDQIPLKHSKRETTAIRWVAIQELVTLNPEESFQRVQAKLLTLFP